MLAACSINAVLALGQAYRFGDPEPRKIADPIVIDQDFVELAGRAIENIYDYTYAIEAIKIGQPTPLVVQRDGQRITLQVVPASRE